MDFLLERAEQRTGLKPHPMVEVKKEDLASGESEEEDIGGTKRQLENSNGSSSVTLGVQQAVRKYKVIKNELKSRLSTIPARWDIQPCAGILEQEFNKDSTLPSKCRKAVLVQDYGKADPEPNEQQEHKEKRPRRGTEQRCKLKYPLRTGYGPNWYEKVRFERMDATSVQRYVNDQGQPFTHIYSYNKVMTKDTIKSICEILNRTDYRVLVWYFNEHETKKCGLRDFILLTKMPMLSTGGEKFTVYVYLKQKPSVAQPSS